MKIYLKNGFPSPLEVDRFISEIYDETTSMIRFRPLSRWIGLYQEKISMSFVKKNSFRPLSRWIGLYPHILCTRQLLATQDVGPTGNTIYIVPYDCRPIKA